MQVTLRPPQHAARSAHTLAGRVAGALLALLLLLYLFTALRTAAGKPLWMDEVLAAWISRFATPARIWWAVAHGAEFSPPTYHILLHGLARLFGDTPLVLRLPSLLAALGCGAAAFVLVRRRTAFAFAALAAALTLELSLYSYAVQARPYALVTACFAVALLAWDGAGPRPSAWRPILVAACLTLATALHFYAGLLVGVLGGMEAARSLAVRRLRARMWLALAVPAASLLAWLPLMRAILRYNAGDTAAANYIARPTLGALLSTYGDLLLGPNSALLTGLALGVALALLLRHLLPAQLAAAGARLPPDSGRDLDFDVMVAATVAIPLAAFAAGVLATHTFNERYALAACLGVAMLYARLASRLPGGGLAACLLLAVSCGLWTTHALHARAPAEDADLALLRLAGGDAPIVIGEGLHYLQLDEAADPALRRRLVFLRRPGTVSPDPTNANQVERWAPLRPDLAIVDLPAFVAKHRAFYLFASPDPKDVVTGYFVQSGEITRVVGRAMADAGDDWLFWVQVK